MISLSLDRDLEEILEALGAKTEESKVELTYETLREGLRERLRNRRPEDLSEQYRLAYAQDGGLGEEFAGWEKQGVWPD